MKLSARHATLDPQGNFTDLVECRSCKAMLGGAAEGLIKDAKVSQGLTSLKIMKPHKQCLFCEEFVGRKTLLNFLKSKHSYTSGLVRSSPPHAT